MSTPTTPRAGTTIPWKSAGASDPCSVTKDKSTIASSGYGLTSDITRRAFSWVVPSAKYQWSEPVVAQAARLNPSDPLTTCSTTVPPPSMSTTAPTTDAGAATFSSTTDRLYGATDTGTVVAGPLSARREMVPRRVAPVALATTINPARGAGRLRQRAAAEPGGRQRASRSPDGHGPDHRSGRCWYRTRPPIGQAAKHQQPDHREEDGQPDHIGRDGRGGRGGPEARREPRWPGT